MGRSKGEIREKTTLRLKKRHLERLKALAENDETTMTEQVDMALIRYLSTRRIRQKKGDKNV